MSSLNYCFGELLDHVRLQCAVYLKGGIDAIAIIESDSSITNYSSVSQWTAAIAAESVKIIKGIKGEWQDGSPVEGENPVGCGNETVLDGFDHTIGIMDYNVSADNDAFWASLNNRRFYLAIRLCNESQILVIELPVNVFALTSNVPMSNKEKQRYKVEFKFSAPSDWYPIRVAEPAGIFD